MLAEKVLAHSTQQILGNLSGGLKCDLWSDDDWIDIRCGRGLRQMGQEFAERFRKEMAVPQLCGFEAKSTKPAGHEVLMILGP